MIFSKGDKVKFLNEVGGGEVVEIIDDNMVMIETQDGFRMPYLISELIPEGKLQMEVQDEPVPEVYSQTEPETGSRNQTVISRVEKEKSHTSTDVSFALVNQFMSDGMVLNAYIINMSSYNILFHLGVIEGSGVKTLAFDELETEEKLLIGPLPEIVGDTLLRVHYQIIFFKNELYQALEPLSGNLSLNNETLLSGDSFTENVFFEEKAMLFPLVSVKKMNLSASKIQEQVLEKGDVKLSPSETTKAQEPEGDKVEEIDLHANAIVDNPAGMEPAEILELQVARFEIALEGAVRNKQKKIIFIHGRGEGKLKYRIRKIIEDKYPGLKYQDASFKEYGYGATLVIIK
jgi:hypothetical protein